ncbi:MAG: hypothetical protein H7Y30_05740, partial [Pyrinomonadaceae bacterium]|nr:hypothetical protein [Pyrinomonadaceae bacterium]
MREESLSIRAKDEEIEIKTSRSDIAATLIKGIVGAAPVVGPMVAEVVSTVIPNQKLDRLIIFVKVLEDKIKYIEEDVLKEKIKSEEFTDLLEDGLNQAARALSEERKQYLASLLKNSLTKDELSHIEEKKLLSILSELNDIEIIVLKYESLYPEEQDDFWEAHKEIFERPDVYVGAPQENIDRDALYNSYRENLIRLGLLKGK